MLKIGVFYQENNCFFKTCSIFPTHLSAQEQMLLCERFAFGVSHDLDTPHIICQKVTASERSISLFGKQTNKKKSYAIWESFGNPFLLSLDALSNKKAIVLECDRCLYCTEFKEKKPMPHIICNCGLRLPRPVSIRETAPSMCPYFRPREQFYATKKLEPSAVSSMLLDLLGNYTLTDSEITSDKKRLSSRGCIGGSLDEEEFEQYLYLTPDETVVVIKHYWDIEQHRINPMADGFSISKQEFDYVFYKFRCDVMYTLFYFPESKRVVASHCEEIYFFNVE